MDLETFHRRVRSGLVELVRELQEETCRVNPEESAAWAASLPALSDALSHEDLRRFHLHLGRRGNLSLEYRLPASASWVDAALLGRTPARAVAVLIELKNWDTWGDRPGPRAGLVLHRGALVLHPSEQVRGYVEYCQGFHSAVREYGADVKGCAFITGSPEASGYRLEPHADLVREYPLFTAHPQDAREHLPAFIASNLYEPDPDFAERFEKGGYVQDRNLMLQLASAVSDPDSTPFVLLDRQREGFEHCLKRVDHALTQHDQHKTVIIVEGPPGSGKSVLAARLWAHLVKEERITGSVVLTSTSSSQKDNWRSLFERAVGGPAGRGVVIPANQYNPGMTPSWVKRQRDAGHRIEVSTWRENLTRYHQSGALDRSPDDSIAISIVDEAHALIDPTLPGKEGVPTSGWVHHAGAQAWHIIRTSQVSIFLLDGDQSYRDNETTTPTRIREFAAEFGVHDVEHISLAGAQFRCGGSIEYMDWLEGMLSLRSTDGITSAWRASAGGPFSFEVVDALDVLDERLSAQVAQGRSVRLLASYARRWVTRDVANPHDLPSREKDFYFRYRAADGMREWARIWNFVNKEDYRLFVQAPDGSRMAEDPLCEVGCPYVVRGFDYDYIGVLWLSDLVWREDRWIAQPEHVHESAWKNTLAAARREQKVGYEGPATEELTTRLQRAYRVLLSRAIRGVYLWFEDDETREHVESMLRGRTA